MAWLLGGLKGVFWPLHHTHCVRKGLGTCVSLDLPALLHSVSQSPQWLYWCCGQPAASTLFVRTDSFSNENGASLRLCNVQKLVLSGPCFADVNVEKVRLLSPNIWTFWWCFRAALQNMWYIRWVFVCRCRRLVVEALRCFVFLWFKEITLFNEYYCHGKYVSVNVFSSCCCWPISSDKLTDNEAEKGMLTAK